jgi:hypothetical protein
MLFLRRNKRNSDVMAVCYDITRNKIFDVKWKSYAPVWDSKLLYGGLLLYSLYRGSFCAAWWATLRISSPPRIHTVCALHQEGEVGVGREKYHNSKLHELKG